MIIDTSYFIGEISIPNLNKAGNEATLENDIEFYETEILKDLFGYQLYAAYIAGMAVESPDQKWVDITEGAEFSFDFLGKTITRKWIGFTNSDKISILAYYTYANYIRRVMQTLTGVGMAVGQTELSQIASGTRKQVNAWNRFMDQYGKTPLYFNGYYDSDYIHYDDTPSIYNFLVANSDDYDDWIFTRREDISVFGF